MTELKANRITFISLLREREYWDKARAHGSDIKPRHRAHLTSLLLGKYLNGILECMSYTLHMRLPSVILKEAMRPENNAFLKHIQKDDTWQGGYLTVPFNTGRNYEPIEQSNKSWVARFHKIRAQGSRWLKQRIFRSVE